MSKPVAPDTPPPAPFRWVGIDEAGYGPNLGPLVMTAVAAESPPGDRPPDLWGDLPATLTRAGDRGSRLWVDDSKRVKTGSRGLERLERTAHAAITAVIGQPPTSLASLLTALNTGTPADSELQPWLTIPQIQAYQLPRWANPAHIEADRTRNPFAGAPWRLAGIRSELIAPTRFNARLAHSRTKADVHFASFAVLLSHHWNDRHTLSGIRVRSDKHGGRHFYMEPLTTAFPDLWIDRGPETPPLSRYHLRDHAGTLELELRPRADQDDGLVALASIVSKYLRELWMDVFNAYWIAALPGLPPTAGYPVDAARFRSAIAATAHNRGHDPHTWWRSR